MLNSHMLLVTQLLCFSQNKNIFAVPSDSLLHLCYTSPSGLYFLLAFLWCCHHSNQKLLKHFFKKGQRLCSYGVYENWTASSTLRSWVSIYRYGWGEDPRSHGEAGKVLGVSAGRQQCHTASKAVTPCELSTQQEGYYRLELAGQCV